MIDAKRRIKMMTALTVLFVNDGYTIDEAVELMEYIVKDYKQTIRIRDGRMQENTWKFATPNRNLSKSEGDAHIG